MQVRKADFGKPDLEARTVPVTLCSDFPVQRDGFIEVLDVHRADVSRAPLPLLVAHDANQLNVGVVRDIRIDGNRLRGEALFGASARAAEILQDVRDGVISGISVGYRLLDEGRPIQLRDGTSAQSFGFALHEVSIVPIPADPTVGFNRSRQSPSLKSQKEILMTNQTNTGSRSAAEIIALGEAHANRGGVELALQFIRERRGLEEFRAAIMDGALDDKRPPQTVTVRQADGGRLSSSFSGAFVARRGEVDFTAIPSGASATLGDQMVRAFSENADLFNRTKSMTMQLRAAGDLITTASGRTIVTGAAGFINGGVLGLQNALPIRGADAGALEYARYTGQQGAAAVQAAEGDSKAAVRPDHTLVTQTALTIAGYAKMSRQALKDSNELRRAVDVTLSRSVATALDAALVNGATGFAGGFETLATAYTSLVYTALVDAISEAVATMQVAGFSPDVVSLNPADWLAITVAKSAGDGQYFSGSYLGSIEPMLRGLRVVLSPSVDSGKALVMDSTHSELLLVEDFNVELGYVSDDFVKNQAVILGEMRVIPVFRTVGSARLITPKA